MGQTDTQTGIATTRLNRPRGQSSENLLPLVAHIICEVLDTCLDSIDYLLWALLLSNMKLPSHFTLPYAH